MYPTRQQISALNQLNGAVVVVRRKPAQVAPEAAIRTSPAEFESAGQFENPLMNRIDDQMRCRGSGADTDMFYRIKPASLELRLPFDVMGLHPFSRHTFSSLRVLEELYPPTTIIRST